MAYKVYTTDAYYLLTRCLAGENGLRARFYDVMFPAEQPEIDGDAIAASIIGRIAVKGGEE